jgi:uncharacterized protein (DUF2235 family)
LARPQAIVIARESQCLRTFCADGTWDDPNNNSNVCQLYTALENLPGVQIPIYDSGVGSSGTPVDKMLGGAVGAGLFQKIKDGYSAISAQYQPGDQIFIFGFSRGAYTARSLAGMISICGLPTVNQQDSACLDMAFEAYRNAAQRDLLLDMLNTSYKMDNAKIRLLGVWDTVGSLGIPALFGSIDVIQYGFLSTTLHEDVVTAVQALSIDEQRMQFQPAVFAPSVYPNQTLVQVWFSGVHCDVGGGYAPDQNRASPSNIPLLWMASYAKAAGLQFKAGTLSNALLALDAAASLHESRTGAYQIFPAHVRNIPSDSCLASSAKVRCDNPKTSYAPENLHFVAGQVANTYTPVDVGSIVI